MSWSNKCSRPLFRNRGSTATASPLRNPPTGREENRVDFVGSLLMQEMPSSLPVPTVSHLFGRVAALSWQKPPARVLP